MLVSISRRFCKNFTQRITSCTRKLEWISWIKKFENQNRERRNVGLKKRAASFARNKHPVKRARSGSEKSRKYHFEIEKRTASALWYFVIASKMNVTVFREVQMQNSRIRIKITAVRKERGRESNKRQNEETSPTVLWYKHMFSSISNRVVKPTRYILVNKKKCQTATTRCVWKYKKV